MSQYINLDNLLTIICQDEIPAGGCKNFRAETNSLSEQMNIKDLIAPKLEDGSDDLRFASLASQILENISQSTINELSHLWRETNQLEDRYERFGLRFVIGMFQVEMEGWQ